MAAFPVLLFLVVCGVARCSVYNDKTTVTKARCYANCLTEVSKSAGPDPGCLTNPCRLCVLPCDRQFTTTASCKTNCGNSTICQKSCDFLEHLKRLPNVLLGNNSLTIRPGVPMATAKTLKRLTLSWNSAKSTLGSVVYLLKKGFEGDFSRSLRDLTDLVFTEPRAVLDILDVCRDAPSFRLRWNGIQFKFQVIALTEYSQLVASAGSSKIEMRRPEPVSDIGVPSFSYDVNTPGDKLKLTTTVTPFPAQVSVISNYAMFWSMAYCDPIVTPRSHASKGASTTISMHIYEKLKPCNHTLEVYSLNQCIPSLPRSLVYQYKGCRFVKNFNKTLCYSFDPPPTPDSARAVGSLSFSPLKPTGDFRFNTKITWLPPTFAFGQLQYYSYAYGDTTKKLFGVIWLATRGSTRETFLKLQNILPSITFKVEVTPAFPNAVGVTRKIIFRTPGIPADQIMVRHVTADNFEFSDSSLFSVRVRWQKPLLSNQLYGYRVDFVKGNDSKRTVNTNQTSFVFRGLIHNEPLVVEVKPLYRVRWVKPKGVAVKLQAPPPYAEEVMVRYIHVHNFTHDARTNTYTAYFKWNPPSYRYKTVDHYEVGYTLIGSYNRQELTCPSSVEKKVRRCMPATTVEGKSHSENSSETNYYYNSSSSSRNSKNNNSGNRNVWSCLTSCIRISNIRKLSWKESFYSIPRVHPHGHIVIRIKPVFKNSPFVNGIKETFTVDVPYAPVTVCHGKPAGYYADVQDCTAFYHCDANQGTFHMFCPAGLYWNSVHKSCDWPRNVNCQKNNQSCCEGKQPGFYEHKQNLAAFCECDAQGRGFLRMCPSGLHWNDSRKACDLPSNAHNKPKK